MVRVTGVQTHVEPYQRLKKWYLIPPCSTLSIIRYVSSVKWSNPGKGLVPSPTPRRCSYWKRSLRVALDYSRQLYFFIFRKKLDGIYTRMLRAILNKSWRQHSTKQQLHSHPPPITKTIKVRRTRHARHCSRSMDELISDVLLWTSSHGRAKAGRPARTYMQQLCVALRTCWKQWMIGRKGERGSGISALMARHDDYRLPTQKWNVDGYLASKQVWLRISRNTSQKEGWPG